MATKSNRDALFGWLRTFFKDRGLELRRSGPNTDINGSSGHTIDLGTGYWSNPNYSGAKPVRWLMHVDPNTAPVSARVPAAHLANRIGQGNTAQGNVGALAVRIIPVFTLGAGSFQAEEQWEIGLLFYFPSALPVGSSAETFDINPATGLLTYLGAPLPYLGAALMGLQSRADALSVGGKVVTYGEVVDAIQSALPAKPLGQGSSPISAYDLTSDTEIALLKSDITNAYKTLVPITNEVPQNSSLLGIDPSVFRQVNAALRAGKRHIMLYGPPGTGKTTLARHIGETLSPGAWTLITGSADWSSQDIIGGYQPIGSGNVAFQSGVLLRDFDRPLIIDEINRCDIDKVLGPLFTVLSGQQTTLPYRLDVSDANSPQYVILPETKTTVASHEFAPGPSWRIIATLNSIDKASLYQMSYALSRRFGWVYVDAPTDLKAFIQDFLTNELGTPLPISPADPCPLADIWTAINNARPLGPAPIIDAIRAIRAIDPAASFFTAPSAAMQEAVLDALDTALLPMLDGIVSQEADAIGTAIVNALALTGGAAQRVRNRLQAVAV